MKLVATSLSKMELDVGPPYHFPKDLHKLGPEEVYRPFPWDSLSEEQKRFQATKMAIHAAMIDRMDIEIGRVIDQLKAMGAFENTIICFASDNGASAEIMVRSNGHDPSVPLGSAASYLCLARISALPTRLFVDTKRGCMKAGRRLPLSFTGLRDPSPRGIEEDARTRNRFRAHYHGYHWGQSTNFLERRIHSPMAGKSLAPSFQKDVTINRDLLWWMHDGHRAVRVTTGNWWRMKAKHGNCTI